MNQLIVLSQYFKEPVSTDSAAYLRQLVRKHVMQLPDTNHGHTSSNFFHQSQYKIITKRFAFLAFPILVIALTTNVMHLAQG
jgi:hypothetical protein